MMKNFLRMIRYCCLKLQGYLVSKCRGGTSGSGVLTCVISLCCRLQMHTIASLIAKVNLRLGRALGGMGASGGRAVRGEGREEGEGRGQQLVNSLANKAPRRKTVGACCFCRCWCTSDVA